MRYVAAAVAVHLVLMAVFFQRIYDAVIAPAKGKVAEQYAEYMEEVRRREADRLSVLEVDWLPPAKEPIEEPDREEEPIPLDEAVPPPAETAEPGTSDVARPESAPPGDPDAPDLDLRFLPPRPIEVVWPEYPRGVPVREGTVVLLAYVDVAGRVVEVRVDQGMEEAYDEAAIRAARLTRFLPARRGGRPVPAWVRYPITFRSDR
jgi:protein TonB